MNEKLLYKVLYYWGDLEDTFQNKLNVINSIRKKQNREEISTRLELVKVLTGFLEKDNITRINHLRGRLEEEVGTYTPEEFETYSRLMEIMNGVDELLRSGEIQEIADLNMLSRLAEAQSRVSKSAVSELPVGFFEGLRAVNTNAKQEDVANLKDLEQIYSITGMIGDTFIYKNGKVESHISANDIIDYFVLRNESDIDTVISEVTNKVNKFAVKLIKCMSNLQEHKKLKYNTIFLTNKYFTIAKDESKATIKIGKSKFECKLNASNKCKDEESGLKYYSVKCTINNSNVQAVLVM